MRWTVVGRSVRASRGNYGRYMKFLLPAIRHHEIATTIGSRVVAYYRVLCHFFLLSNHRDDLPRRSEAQSRTTKWSVCAIASFLATISVKPRLYIVLMLCTYDQRERIFGTLHRARAY